MRAVVVLAVLALAAPAAAQPLKDAARLKDLEGVRAALAGGADPNGFPKAYSPLMFAAGNGEAEMTRLLLAHGAQTEHRDQNGDRALLWAAQRGHLETARLLVDAGSPADSDDDPYGRTPLLAASRYGHDEVIALLLERGAHVRRSDSSGQTALHAAVLAQDTPLVALLLKAGADPKAATESLRETPLHLAVQRGKADMARMLAEAGADLETRDKDGRTALLDAAARGHDEVVEVLLAHGARADLDPAFAAATWKGDADLPRRLFEKGAKIDAVDLDGRSALAGAASHEGSAMTEWFLARKPDLARHGAEALHEAAKGGNTQAAVLLLDGGVPVDARDAKGATALMLAAGQGRTETVRLLVERGADPNARTPDGKGAADHMAASVSMLEDLIEGRERSRAYRPTHEQRAEVERLKAAHAEIEKIFAGAG